MVEVESKLIIKDLDDLLLFEINERVKSYMHTAKEDYLKFEETDIEIMKMDKKSLEECFSIGPQGIINNLKSKLDFLIELSGKE